MPDLFHRSAPPRSRPTPPMWGGADVKILTTLLAMPGWHCVGYSPAPGDHRDSSGKLILHYRYERGDRAKRGRRVQA